REISVWKRLSHPNVQEMCGLYYGLGPLPALVSPWSNAGDINDYLSKERCKPRGDEAQVGTCHVHDHSVVHGDIKGGNVLISDGGAARLSDFGLSNLLVRYSQSFTQDSVVKGTSRWMAPELFIEEEPRLTYASDMWAFGCLLIEVQSGRLPYYNKANDQQVIIALSKHELPARSPDIPDLLWSIVLDCCTIDPHGRPEIAFIGRTLNRYRVLLRVSCLVSLVIYTC
ncbi:kinase-like protein, partial [Exidia glandulosa HHB12029]